MSTQITGKYWLILWLSTLAAGFLPAQNCTTRLNEAKSAYKNKNFRLAFNKLQDTETCDYKNILLKERQALQNDIFNAIEEQRKEAEKNAQLAKENAQKVITSQAETQKALQQAQAALDSLKKVLYVLDNANADKVRLILAEVARSQRELNFNAAVDKIKTAKILRALPDSVNLAYQNLSRLLLAYANKDIQAKAYQGASQKIKSAGELNVEPASVQVAEQELQRLLFENLDLDIKNSDYDTALTKINILKKLQVPSDTIESLLFEIAFCYTETGRPDQAEALLDSIARLRHDDALSPLLRQYPGKEPGQRTETLRQILQQFNPAKMVAIKSRYFSNGFVVIPSGVFTTDACSINVHPFALSTQELTFYEFDLFSIATGRTKPSDKSWGRGSQPVIDVSWFDAAQYCNWRSEREGLQKVYTFSETKIECNWSANGYRLPSEVEWEFAAGNGIKKTRFAWGDALPAAQNGGNVSDETTRTKFPDWEIFKGYSDGFINTAPVGSYNPNEFGLYDMTGNVWEWCWDAYSENFCQTNKDGNNLKGTAPGQDRVLRGGSWGSFMKDCLVSNRFHNKPEKRNFSTGFRLAKN